MKKIICVLFGIFPCLLFGQTQDAPSYQELDKSLDSSLGQGELVKKPKPKKKKVIKKKKAKKIKKLRKAK